MEEKLSHSPAGMENADVLNTLDFVEVLEYTDLGKDILGIVGNIQKAQYYCKNITINSSNYIT